MKNIFLVLFCIGLFSCTKNEKKEGVPVQKIEYVTPEEMQEVEVVVEDKLVFTVQIAALQNTNDALANLEDVAIYQENGFTKYRLGGFETYQEAKKLRSQIIIKYKGAFVQALLNDAPIVITEALQY
ncbi:SPOR domain-containing protein [Polaribacter sp. IC073]|uniref:SPOR domain-containing protein n=1 Tax=Polaribacter sp. IC073 TaxID=2508540 RepID=UPI0011BFD545|nr:SPOR domain-containing protein [Polaribacter sp. IC073]TXD46561.1 SPOR domain-containing protein [Polaribacter sp. IC073]